MIIQEIKSQIKEAMLSKNIVKRDILRLVVGQAQQSGDESDKAILAIIKKIIKSNQETMNVIAVRDLESQQPGTPIVSNDMFRIVTENDVLNYFLPKTMSVEDIHQFIKSNNIDVKSASNDGQAMGILMKSLKLSGNSIDSSIVQSVIKEIRS